MSHIEFLKLMTDTNVQPSVEDLKPEPKDNMPHEPKDNMPHDDPCDPMMPHEKGLRVNNNE